MVELPPNVKKDEVVIETTHDDKNISKKVEKAESTKKQKTDQSHNTEMSFQTKKKTDTKAPSVKEDDLVSNASSLKKSPPPEEKKGKAVATPDSPVSPKKKNGDKKGPSVLRLREVAVTTEIRHWKEGE